MVSFVQAKKKHLEEIINLLASDKLGKIRENNSQPLPTSYQKAFERIDSDPNALLITGVVDNSIIAVAQLNILHYLTYQGGTRALIEGVRVHQSFRGQGIGEKLFMHLISLATKHHCHIVQLTTDKSRPDAHRFYEKLGFQASHEGFKLHLSNQ